MLAFDRVVLALAPGLGFAAVWSFIAAVLRLAAVRALDMVPAGLAAVRDLTDRVAVRERAVVLADRAVVLPDLAAVRDLAAVVVGLPAVRFAAVLGLATRLADEVVLDPAIDPAADILAPDIDLAAIVSDLAAVVMALVAVFIACMAVDIVLADDVAFVAAAVILVAADVTFVAADETVRAATAVDGEFVDAALRVVDLAGRDVLLEFLFGRLAARLGALLAVDLVRALAGLRRAAVRVVVRAGTDLPPSRSITQVLFHTHRGFTHPLGVLPAEQWPQADENSR